MPLHAGCLRLVELFSCPGANLIQFGVEPSDLDVKFNEGQAGRSDQSVGLNTRIILATTGFQVYAGGGLLGPRIAPQVQEIKTRGFHNGAIIPHIFQERCDAISTGSD
jgi:hypothetical protein